MTFIYPYNLKYSPPANSRHIDKIQRLIDYSNGNLIT